MSEEQQTPDPLYDERREIQCQTEEVDAYFSPTKYSKLDCRPLQHFTSKDVALNNSAKACAEVIRQQTRVDVIHKGNFTIALREPLRFSKVITPSKFVQDTAEMSKSKEFEFIDNTNNFDNDIRKNETSRVPHDCSSKTLRCVAFSKNNNFSILRKSTQLSVEYINSNNTVSTLNSGDTNVQKTIPQEKEPKLQPICSRQTEPYHNEIENSIATSTLCMPDDDQAHTLTLEDTSSNECSSIETGHKALISNNSTKNQANTLIIEDKKIKTGCSSVTGGHMTGGKTLTLNNPNIKLLLVNPPEQLKSGVPNVKSINYTDIGENLEGNSMCVKHVKGLNIDQTDPISSHNIPETNICVAGFDKKPQLSVKKMTINQLSANVYHEIVKVAKKLQNSRAEQELEGSKKKKYECDICHSSFTKSCNLSAHKRIHTNDKRFECNICQKKFYVRSKLRAHLVTHAEVRPHSCEICPKSFKELSVLKRHMLTHDGKKFTCTVCQKKFISKGQLDIHKKLHTSEKPYRCEHCNKRFAVIYYYRRHVRKHDKNKRFICDICNKGFHLKESFKLHCLTHNDLMKKRCDLCLKSFIKESQLKNHKCKGKPTTILECTQCDAKFSTRSDLLIHKKEHTGEEVYTCDICKKKFLNEFQLKRHLAVHNDKKQYKCKLCNAEFGWLSSVRSHIQTQHEKEIQSKEEDPTYASSIVEQKHQSCNEQVPIDIGEESTNKVEQSNQTHPVLTVVASPKVSVRQVLNTSKDYAKNDSIATVIYTAVPTGNNTCSSSQESAIPTTNDNSSQTCDSRDVDVISVYRCEICQRSVDISDRDSHNDMHLKYPYICSFCSMNFQSEYFLQKHLLIHTGDKPHRCNRCGDLFETLQQLSTHREEHILEENKPHQCSECSKRFCRVSDLKIHVRIHSGEKPYGCDMCAETFSRSEYLKRHKLRKHGIGTLFKCEKCPKECSESYQLKRHVEYVHTKNKPFVCPICSKAYVRKYELDRHVSNHEENMPIKCSLCKKGFKKKSSYNKHMKETHTGSKNASSIISQYVSKDESERFECEKELMKTTQMHPKRISSSPITSKYVSNIEPNRTQNDKEFANSGTDLKDSYNNVNLAQGNNTDESKKVAHCYEVHGVNNQIHSLNELYVVIEGDRDGSQSEIISDIREIVQSNNFDPRDWTILSQEGETNNSDEKVDINDACVIENGADVIDNCADVTRNCYADIVNNVDVNSNCGYAQRVVHDDQSNDILEPSNILTVVDHDYTK